MVRVKICGITNLLDAKAAAEAGADSLGFNFYERSLRRISTPEAATIRTKLGNNIETVGVFVNTSAQDIISLRSFVRFSAAQLHGDETPDAASRVSAAGIPVIKAFRVGADFAAATLEKYSEAHAFLLDGARAGQYGGTGETTNWGFAQRVAKTHRIILAGGLTVENVADAIRFVKPYSVDVASGLESKPGKKDHGKLREFIDEVRRAGSELEPRAESAGSA
jgi:phosphoribosylanthranilate isomerase